MSWEGFTEGREADGECKVVNKVDAVRYIGYVRTPHESTNPNPSDSSAVWGTMHGGELRMTEL